MKIERAEIASGFRIRVRITPEQGESDADALLDGLEAGFDAMPDGEQAQSVRISWERDRGGRRVGSRRAFLTILTGPRIEYRTPNKGM